MKKIAIIISLVFHSLTYGQTQWKVVYQYKRVETAESKKRSDSIQKKRPEFAQMMKRFLKIRNNKVFELKFSNATSLFKQQEALEKPGVRNVSRWGNRRTATYYVDLKKKEYINAVSNYDKD